VEGPGEKGGFRDGSVTGHPEAKLLRRWAETRGREATLSAGKGKQCGSSRSKGAHGTSAKTTSGAGGARGITQRGDKV